MPTWFPVFQSRSYIDKVQTHKIPFDQEDSVESDIFFISDCWLRWKMELTRVEIRCRRLYDGWFPFHSCWFFRVAIISMFI